ncbi:unnamed protein product [Rotaria socialis]|uniref:Uncharacterized protein n=1 Tax=Rotaria socialis TaxID=392032 RepID=A0A820BG00_9BILA|nr:unnamed protein product [Rotaria socialis]CAF3421754.1 unnamed protein product [Rotaria socialis]CAF3482338.1 unnamed protein product [Rotaria socialis]CAF3558199.1 unnamed protein product [Rotaria socialis]CAF4162728.1 unnamed protein product [Rotaria socialis]
MVFPDVSSNVILSEYEQCNAPLGMESGSIGDSDLTSSSTHDLSSVGPQMARIRTELEGGAWCPDKPIGPKSYEYVQIELHKLYFINAIETQGRFDNGQGNEYAEYYQIEYQRENNSSNWITYNNKKTNKTVLKGNINTYLAEKRFLLSPIIAKRIRIIPYSSRWRTVCMRVELYGCAFIGGIVSYTTSPSIDKDNVYDGGVGKLIDGIIGDNEDSRLSWNKSPVLVQFHFDTYYHFKTIRIYSVNNKYRSVQIKIDNNLPMRHKLSTSLSKTFADTIHLNQSKIVNIGKRVELLFEFDNGLLSLTEITFDNEPTILYSTTSTSVTTTNCPLACSALNNKITLLSSSSSSSSSSLSLSSSSSSSTIIPLEWLTILIFSTLSLCFILLFTLVIIRIRNCHLRKNSNPYYKCSRLTSTANGSSVENNQNQSTRKINYDDLTSIGSYIYPITSTTSLLHTSSPSSLFKSEQYAIIDANSYAHCSTNNTFHYASSDIGQMSSKLVNLFNCSAIQEVVPSKYDYSLPSCVDQSKLFSVCKISESNYGEIFKGKYSLDNQSKSVLIKIIKSDMTDSTKQRFLSELGILSRLNHINIACVCAVQLDLLYFVQEHSDFGTLQHYYHKKINDLTFQKMNIYFSHQLSNALEYLSHLNIIHNDIAARNCLFYSDYTIKLTDCAMALSQYEHEYWLSNNGDKIPLRWIAPEALINNSTLKSDIYSFAVTLWELWSRCSYLPHASLTNEELYQYLVFRQSSNRIETLNESIIRLSQPVDCSKEIYDLLCECWHIDGTKRPNISDIALYFTRQINSLS